MPTRHLRKKEAERFDDSDEFDDDAGLDAFETELDNVLPGSRAAIDSAKPFIDPVVNEVLPPGIIDIRQEVGCLYPREHALPRIHHHFADTDLGYRSLRSDMFKLRVRPRDHPWFGTFTGVVQIRENIERVPGAPASYRRYDIDGLLRYRPSAVWVSFIAVSFFILLLITQIGFLPSLVFFCVGVGVTIGTTYRLGRDERDEVEDRLNESFLRLRATIHNRR